METGVPCRLLTAARELQRDGRAPIYMPKHVLIVDDSLAMRRRIAHALESGGFTVTKGGNGAEGLTLLAQWVPDLIIADVNMPEMDGITFTGIARQLPGARMVPVLLLTTGNMTSRVSAGRRAGATDWLAKPFKPELLLEVVGRLLS